MKKILNLLGLLFLVFAMASCEKHEITYPCNDVEEGSALLQLHYVAPVAAKASNYINKVEINDNLVTLNNLAPYNFIPSGTVGIFYAVKAGTVNIKFYQGAKDSYTLVYDHSVNLAANKRYNVFVHNLDKDPIVVEHPDPYEKGTPWVDTLSYFLFANFYHAEDGVTPVGKLQLKLRSVDVNPVTEEYDYENIGNPINFGEFTDWIWLPIKKAVKISSGYQTRYFKVMVVHDDGTETDLPYVNSASKPAVWTDYWSWYVGRRYLWVLGGKYDPVRKNQIVSSKRFTLL